MKAVYQGRVIAQSDETIVIENNHYFPPSSINAAYFQKSQTTSFCGWKGEANYYSVTVEGHINKDAAWYYPNPKDAAKNIACYVAFWKGIKVEP